jgi:hypothetical protein
MPILDNMTGIDDRSEAADGIRAITKENNDGVIFKNVPAAIGLSSIIIGGFIGKLSSKIKFKNADIMIGSVCLTATNLAVYYSATLSARMGYNIGRSDGKNTPTEWVDKVQDKSSERGIL